MSKTEEQNAEIGVRILVKFHIRMLFIMIWFSYTPLYTVFCSMFSTVTGWVTSSPVEESLWPSSTFGTEAIVTSAASCHSGDRRVTPGSKVTLPVSRVMF